MKDVNRRNKSVRSALIALLAVGAVALLARGILGPNGVSAYLQKRSQLAALRHQIQQMQQVNQNLQKEVRGLKSDPATIERHAREDLHMARQHEMIYVFPRQDSDSSAAAVDQRPSSPPTASR